MGLALNVQSERHVMDCTAHKLLQFAFVPIIIRLLNPGHHFFSFTCSNTLNNNTFIIFIAEMYGFFIIIVVCGFQKQLAVFLLPV